MTTATNHARALDDFGRLADCRAHTWAAPGLAGWSDAVASAEKCARQVAYPQAVHNHRPAEGCTAKCIVIEPSNTEHGGEG